MFFRGRLYYKPGSYSFVDATGLAVQGLSATGVVALVGSAIGGKPAGDMIKGSELVRLTRPGKEGDYFRGGDLYEAVPLAFEPADDEDIQGGASVVIPVKVDPDTQATATFTNASGDSLVLTSADYGEDMNQIAVEIADGTNQGKRIAVTLEDVVQAVDNIGGDPFFTLIYRPATGAGGVGWEAMTAEILANGQLRCSGSFANAGLDGAVSAGLSGAYTIVSSNAGDTTQVVTVYGLSAGVPTRRQATLNGVTPVALGNFDAGDVFGVILSGTTLGNITVRDSAVTTVLTVTTGQVQSGAVKTSAFFVNGALTQVSSGASTNAVWYVGRNAAGSVVIDRLALTGASPVTSAVTTLVTLEAIVLGEVEAAQTVTISGKALQSSITTQNTLQKLADYVNARQVTASPDPYGFELLLTTTRTTFAVALLDLTVAAVNVFSPVTGSFYADLQLLVEAVNNGMDLVTAAAATGAIGVPTNTSMSTFLSGGTNGTALQSHWQYALDLLKQVFVNFVVVISPDPAVHAALKAHCAYMAGDGKKERSGLVGILNTGLTDLADKDEIRAQILALNSRHIQVVAESVERFNHEGERETFSPPFHAVLAAGAKAGAGLGGSITFKYANALAFNRDSSWNPVDDAEELIQAGLLFTEEVEGVGTRWVRNITTHLSSSNIAFTDATVNEAVNYSVYTFRTNMEAFVGAKGTQGTVNQAKAGGGFILNQLIAAEALVDWRGLTIEKTLDILDVVAEIAPTIPVNFVRTVLHLNSFRQTA